MRERPPRVKPSWDAPCIFLPAIYHRRPRRPACPARYKWSDLQDFGSQSSQIGPHLVQPFSRRPMAITLKISANRRNIVHPLHSHNYTPPSQAFSSRGIFKCCGARLDWAQSTYRGKPAFMPGRTTGGRIRHRGSTAGSRGCVRAVGRDLGLSVEQIECAPPANAAADWQPGATLRMAFSERLCRHGGIVCGQALMALADTSMVLAILAANRGYRPMTTVSKPPTSCAPLPHRTCWPMRGWSASDAT